MNRTPRPRRPPDIRITLPKSCWLKIRALIQQSRIGQTDGLLADATAAIDRATVGPGGLVVAWPREWFGQLINRIDGGWPSRDLRPLVDALARHDADRSRAWQARKAEEQAAVAAAWSEPEPEPQPEPVPSAPRQGELF